MGGAPKPDLDIEGLMGEPGGEMGEPGDSMAEEGSETSLEAALESAGYTVSPDVLNKIKALLGDAGAMSPAVPGEEDLGGESIPPPPAAPTSKLGKMFGGMK
jgi:hypothetical protein